MGSDGKIKSGPICDENWLDDKKAEIVCENLGFETGSFERHSAFGSQTETHVMIPNKVCDADVENIQKCGSYLEDENLSSCGEDDIAGVFCYQKSKIEKGLYHFIFNFFYCVSPI